MKSHSDVNAVSPAMQSLVDLLFAEQVSCVVRSGNTIRLFRQRGVDDLYRLLNEEPEWLRGSRVADKVVGKGAAALMILGGVRELFSDVISYPALELLARYHLPVGYTIAVERIVNRTQTGPCPIEERCLACESPEECLKQIEDFILSSRR